MLRRGWMGIVQVAAIVALAGGAVAAMYAERDTMDRGLGVLAHTRVGWVLVGVGAEFVSMAAFGELERLLLRTAGARLTLRSVLATAYNANAIAVSVPVVGSAIAAAYAFRDFRRGGADAGQASIALTVAGVFSAVAFAVVAAVGVALTGNPAGAVLALAGGLAGAALVAALLVSVRHDRARARLVALVGAAGRGVRRVTGRPRRDVAQLLGAALERAGSLRLGYGAAALAFGCALVNWLADVGCLVCVMFALGVPVPWSKILVAWTAGAGAASLSPVPGGIGVVEAVLIAALVGIGVRAPAAVATTLLYRFLTFKIALTVFWFAYHYLQQRRAAGLPATVPALAGTGGPVAAPPPGQPAPPPLDSQAGP
jgi:uncharacterized membrane protein YbhN (UPF0104 family)